MFSTNTIRYALIFIGSAMATCASADIYKWVDANGDTHYTQKKPSAETAKVEKLELGNLEARGNRESVAERNKASLDFAKTREEEDAKRAEGETDLEYDKRYCESLQNRLATLERPRVNMVAEDGTRTRMPEERRQEELTKTRTALTEKCE